MALQQQRLVCWYTLLVVLPLTCVCIEEAPCTEPPSISNGCYSPQGPFYTSEDTVTYSCNDGYTLSGSANLTCGFTGEWSDTPPTCNDIDECATNADNCHPNAECTNTVGSFTCTCDPGYTGDGVSCTDIDECATNADNCHPNAECTNTVGSFTCTCDPGYTGDGVSCTAMCLLLTVPSNGAINYSSADRLEGTVATYSCDTGYKLSGGTTRTCQSDRTWSGGSITCEDVDECATNTNNCHSNARCTNTNGSSTCSCNSGYTGDGITCTAVGLPTICPLLSVPTNGAINYSRTSREEGTVATYSCHTGYEPSGGTMRNCQSVGTWSGESITCSVVNTTTDPPVSGTTELPPFIIYAVSAGAVVIVVSLMTIVVIVAMVIVVKGRRKDQLHSSTARSPIAAQDVPLREIKAPVTRPPPAEGDYDEIYDFQHITSTTDAQAHPEVAEYDYPFQPRSENAYSLTPCMAYKQPSKM